MRSLLTGKAARSLDSLRTKALACSSAVNSRLNTCASSSSPKDLSRQSFLALPKAISQYRSATVPNEYASACGHDSSDSEGFHPAPLDIHDYRRQYASCLPRVQKANTAWL